MLYANKLEPIPEPLPLLADYPAYVEPMRYERRYLAPPVVNDNDGRLFVRAWRYWYNARGIVEMANRLDAKATAIVMVHPWGLDDDLGLPTPEPAGCRFFCTRDKNLIAHAHIRDVVNPFLARLRDRVALVAYSLSGMEDEIRKRLYASARVRPEELDIAEGEKRLAELLNRRRFAGAPLVAELELDPDKPAIKSYMEQTPSTDAGTRYNGPGYTDLPIPLSSALARKPTDLVFYDGAGYEVVRDHLRANGVRHILLAGYCTDKCVVSTTCGYQNLSRNFNVFLVGDATLATFPGSTTPRFATQVALANAALTQMITQANWVTIE